MLVNTTWFLGYDKNKERELVINEEEEAELVRRIFREYLEGKSCSAIAKGLMKDKIKTITGNIKWWDSTISGILGNEKYMGDALLQKTFTVDFLTKKRVKNTGHAAQYYVEDCHEGIISKAEFAEVQAEFTRRANMRGYSKTGKSAFTSEYPFSGKLFCGECGSKFRRQHFAEATLKQSFLNAFNQLITNKYEIMENCEMIKQVLTDTADLNSEAEKLQDEIVVVTELIRQCVEENARSIIDQADYQQRYSGLVARYEKAKNKLEKNKELRQARRVKREQLDAFIATLLRQDFVLTEFDETLWFAIADKVTVYASDDIQFTFRDGTVIEA